VTDKQGNPIIDKSSGSKQGKGLDAEKAPEEPTNPLDFLNRGNLLKPDGGAE